jgi:hydroxymethylpyrimidine pyrophosphatase-like HAD family hydrolase
MESGKHAPVSFARQKYGFSASTTLVAGDSGHDIPMFKGKEEGVLVSNSSPEMLEWYNTATATGEIGINVRLSHLAYADAVV